MRDLVFPGVRCWRVRITVSGQVPRTFNLFDPESFLHRRYQRLYIERLLENSNGTERHGDVKIITVDDIAPPILTCSYSLYQ